MQPSAQRTGLDWTIVASCLAFIFVLAESAYFEPPIRTLHFFQALIYVAVIVLALRHSKWGYGAGIAIAAFWNGINIFVTTFIRNGFAEWGRFLSTGHIRNPVVFVAAPAGIAHAVLIVSCLFAYARLRDKRWSDLAVLLISGILAIGYFVAIIVVFGPQFLPLLRRALGR